MKPAFLSLIKKTDNDNRQALELPVTLSKLNRWGNMSTTKEIKEMGKTIIGKKARGHDK